MSEFSRETLLNIIETDHVQCGEASALARMALAAMDSSESVELPLDYLQGHKDGLEWAAQLAEANHPETGDWLYDDPIELSKAIRKGPDMPPVQPVADSEPVIVVGDDGGDALSYRRLIQSFEPGTKLYRHAQPALVIPDEMTSEQAYEIGYYYGDPVNVFARGANWMRQHIIDSTLAAAPQLPGSDPATVPGKWIPVSEQMPEVGDIVLTAMGGVVNVGETECSAANCRFFTSVISGRELPATHWMPLPAAPQEVK
ncbi:DUF551 domain-containing protein [Klebsiella pneumoniae]|nr:DUF551 domain-containing protein [Klebsiella pneumoniae]MBA1166238.1 hypothetical protein [Klebsiella pneumoniae subsp. pneumoniae]MBA1493175.1 DUF551 domain-containing protein [Klebsiella pneumoniae]MBA2088754.1 hypothetical protein [Klebsiella pneumoniae subsp. pneumoniae]MBA2094100.1 hypothetical protein [Klebsiella pneumoniae subsp. pneumoniae]MBF7756599.1 DUF551 domain-containing protein [Klebsiella pneumoniae]